MVQFNLLPSVKVEYMKAVRTKRLVTSVAMIASVVSLTILVLLFVNVNIVQKKHISNLTNDIDAKVGELEAIDDIDKVLTVQNQLTSLTTLHEQKPATERVLPFLSKVTPQAASISQTTVDYLDNSFVVTGTADSLATVNKFVDTLKFTKYTVDGDADEKTAFTEVVMTSFSVTNSEATFELNFNFSPELFNNTKEVDLVVPNTITTRSQTEKPSDLFKQPQQTKTPAGQ